jgi:hypothetical protein
MTPLAVCKAGLGRSCSSDDAFGALRVDAMTGTEVPQDLIDLSVEDVA